MQFTTGIWFYYLWKIVVNYGSSLHLISIFRLCEMIFISQFLWLATQCIYKNLSFRIFTIEETNWSTLSPYVVRGSTPQALANVSFYSDHLISLCSLITLFLLKLYIRITVINMFIRSSAVHDSFTTIILQNVSRFSKNCETNGLEYCFLKKYFLSTLCHAMFVPGYLTRLS